MTGRAPTDKRYADFAERLHDAYVRNSDVKHGHGRYVWVARKIGVSREAVSKWFSGDLHPSRENVENLAKLLKITPEHLDPNFYGGISEILRKKEAQDAMVESELDRINKERQTEGTVRFVSFIARMNGAEVERPKLGEDANLVMLSGGKRIPTFVALAVQGGTGLSVVLPSAEIKAWVIVVAWQEGVSFALLNVPNSLIKESAIRISGPKDSVMLPISRQGVDYLVGNKVLSRINKFKGNFAGKISAKVEFSL